MRLGERVPSGTMDFSRLLLDTVKRKANETAGNHIPAHAGEVIGLEELRQITAKKGKGKEIAKPE